MLLHFSTSVQLSIWFCNKCNFNLRKTHFSCVTFFLKPLLLSRIGFSVFSFLQMCYCLWFITIFFWRSSKVTWTMSFSLLYHPCIFYTSLRSILFKEYCFIDYYFSLDRNFKHSLGSKFWYMIYLEKGFDALNGIW